MPALTIETREDGTVLVAPAAQPLDPQAAEQFASLDEAMMAVGKVLGEPEGGSAGADAEGGEAPAPGGQAGQGSQDAGMVETGDSLAPTPPADMEGDMAKGYNRAKKGR